MNRKNDNTRRKLSDLSAKERRELEQMVIAQEKKRIKAIPANAVKQAALNVLWTSTRFSSLL